MDRTCVWCRGKGTEVYPGLKSGPCRRCSKAGRFIGDLRANGLNIELQENGTLRIHSRFACPLYDPFAYMEKQGILEDVKTILKHRG